MQIVIREAVQQDCPRLMELVRELAVYEKAPQEVTVTLDHFEETGFGPHPVWKAFVAEIDGWIVGFALYYIRYSTWKGSRLYLEDIIVTETMRGKGIGKLLFSRLLQEALDKGFTGMMWQVLDWNKPAIRFYERYGARFENGWVNVNLEKNQIEEQVKRKQ